MSILTVNADSIVQGKLYQSDGTSIALSAIGSDDTVVYNDLASGLLELSRGGGQSLTNLSSALGNRPLLLRYGDDKSIPAMDASVFSSLVADLKPLIKFRIDPLAKLQLSIGTDNTQTTKQLVSLAATAKQYGFAAVNVSAGLALASNTDALSQIHNLGLRLMLSLDGRVEIDASATSFFDELIPDLSTTQGVTQAAQLVGTDTNVKLRVEGNQALTLNAALPPGSFGIERNVLISLHTGDEGLIAGLGGYSQFLRDAIAQVRLLVDVDAQTGVLGITEFNGSKVAALINSTSGPISVVVDGNQSSSNSSIRLRAQDAAQLHLMHAQVAKDLNAALYVNGSLNEKLSLSSLQWAGEAGVKRIEVNGTLQLDIQTGLSDSAVPVLLKQIKLLSSHGGGVLTVEMAPADGIKSNVDAAAATKLAAAHILLTDSSGTTPLRITDSSDTWHALLKSKNIDLILKLLVDAGYKKIATTDAHSLFSISEAVAIGKAGLQFVSDGAIEVRSADLGKLTVSDAAALLNAGVDLLSPVAVKGKPASVVMNWDVYSTLATGGLYFSDNETVRVVFKQGDSQALASEHLLDTLQQMSDGGGDILEAATAKNVQLDSLALDVMTSLELSFGKNIAATVLLTPDEFSIIREDPEGFATLRDQMSAVHASAFTLNSSSSTVLDSNDLLALFSVSAHVSAPHARWADSSVNIVKLLPSWDKILSIGLDAIEVDSGRVRLSVELAEKALKAGMTLDGAYDINGTVKQIAAYLKHSDLPTDLTFHANANVADLKAVASNGAALHTSGVEINLSDIGGTLSKLTAWDWSKYASFGVHHVHAQSGVNLTLGAAHSIELGHVIFDNASYVDLRLKAGEALGTGEAQLLHDAGVDRWIDNHGVSHDLFLQS